jgi:hypothetical protein
MAPVDATTEPTNHETSVAALQGVFSSDAALQDAIGRLTRAGFDRAELSIPQAVAPPEVSTSDADVAVENPNTEDDSRQLRTLHTGMAGAVSMMAATGAVIATGGAALPALAAGMVAAAGAAGAAHAASRATDHSQHEHRQDAASHGALVLMVHLRDGSRYPVAENALREAGATEIRTVHVRD